MKRLEAAIKLLSAEGQKKVVAKSHLGLQKKAVGKSSPMDNNKKEVKMQMVVCPYFNAPKGCIKGNTCNMKHVVDKAHVKIIGAHPIKRQHPSPPPPLPKGESSGISFPLIIYFVSY